MIDESNNATQYTYVELLGLKFHLRDSEYSNTLLCHLQSLLDGTGSAIRAIPFDL
jgi:hypothetical protein